MVNVFDVRMIHFIGTLGQIDATVKKHFVPHRLFKITDDLYYPEVEHPILAGDFDQKGIYDGVTIFHLAYLSGIWDLKKKYENHLIKSNIHTKQYLDKWYRAHLFGQYPKTQINPMDIPNVILKNFDIDKDEIYFANRGLELKHSEMVKQWYDYFRPSSVLDLGCGRGCCLKYWEWFVPDSHGIELSPWAVGNAFVRGIGLGNITEESQYLEHDLITAVDVLEHLTKEELDKTLKNMSKYGNKFLFSIPYKGMLDLDADPTHKIKESKEWWEKKLGKYFKIKPAPKDWLFHEQIWIGEKK